VDEEEKEILDVCDRSGVVDCLPAIRIGVHGEEVDLRGLAVQDEVCSEIGSVGGGVGSLRARGARIHGGAVEAFQPNLQHVLAVERLHVSSHLPDPSLQRGATELGLRRDSSPKISEARL
jgi:hypothetical protein